MDKTILLAFIIPSLIIFPFLLVHEADAFKLTNYEIRLEVDFHNEDFVTDLPGMIQDFDNGTIKQDMYDVLAPIAVGQFSTDNIIDDWNINIGTSSDTSVRNSHLVVNPVITEINTAQGVNKATIQDQMVNNMKAQVTTWLDQYGITSYIWKLFYDGGVQIVDES